MEIHQLQTRIDELDDWLRSNTGHHQQAQITINKVLLETERDQLINEIEIINPEILNQ